MWYCVGIMMKWLDVFRVRDGDNERGRWGGVSYTNEFDRWNEVLKRMNQRSDCRCFLSGKYGWWRGAFVPGQSWTARGRILGDLFWCIKN